MLLYLSESAFTPPPGGFGEVERNNCEQCKDLLSGLWEAGQALLAPLLERSLEKEAE